MTAAQAAPMIDVDVRRRADGSMIVTSSVAPAAPEHTIPQRLAHWARTTPDAPYLSEGERVMSYAEVERLRRRHAARLLSIPELIERPLLLLGENGIDHAVMMLAATSVGIPVAVVQPAYGAAAADPWSKLARVVGQVEPALVLADDPTTVKFALDAIKLGVPVRSLLDTGWLDERPGVDDADVDAREAYAGFDTVAKLLFTSGSTGVPKAVPNTQRMMASNMAGLAQIWPFLSQRPPVMVDWLPWSHTFGGNCCFNIALWFGGRLHVDRGKPVPALIGETIAAIRTHRPTLYFNVPIGYNLLLEFLERDPDFARTFFDNLDFLFNAGAAMPASLRARLIASARAAGGRAPEIVGGWGSTETAPFSTVVPRTTQFDAALGIPMPGTTIKLVPDGDRQELRVRGPNVMTGYWRDPEATAAAFDEEGFYRIGDAGRLADPDDPSAGLVFSGRVAENFKLLSGTFVNVGGLRLAAISAGEMLIADAVVVGEGRSELGLLLFLNESACRSFLGPELCAEIASHDVAQHPRLLARIGELLTRHNAAQSGSSTRFARFAVLVDPPSAAHDEITDKGYLNQRRILARRGDAVDALYAAGHKL